MIVKSHTISSTELRQALEMAYTKRSKIGTPEERKHTRDEWEGMVSLLVDLGLFRLFEEYKEAREKGEFPLAQVSA